MAFPLRKGREVLFYAVADVDVGTVASWARRPMPKLVVARRREVECRADGAQRGTKPEGLWARMLPDPKEMDWDAPWGLPALPWVAAGTAHRETGL